MEDKFVITALAALAQPHRLQIFRALVVKGNEGLTPALMAQALGIAANALSFHLKELMFIAHLALVVKVLTPLTRR